MVDYRKAAMEAATLHGADWTAAHQAAWEEVSAHVVALVGTRKAKVFEVHHALEHARRLYFAEMAGGKCAYDAKRVVLAAYNPE